MTQRPPAAHDPGAPHGQGLGDLALALSLLASQAAAQILPTGTPAADILLSQAITEQRVFHTCSAFDAATHAAIIDLWAADVRGAAATLAENNVAPEAIGAFTTAASPDALMPAPGTPFEDVKQFCDAHPDWQATWGQSDIISLADVLPGLFR